MASPISGNRPAAEFHVCPLAGHSEREIPRLSRSRSVGSSGSFDELDFEDIGWAKNIPVAESKPVALKEDSLLPWSSMASPSSSPKVLPSPLPGPVEARLTDVSSPQEYATAPSTLEKSSGSSSSKVLPSPSREPAEETSGAASSSGSETPPSSGSVTPPIIQQNGSSSSLSSLNSASHQAAPSGAPQAEKKWLTRSLTGLGPIRKTLSRIGPSSRVPSLNASSVPTLAQKQKASAEKSLGELQKTKLELNKQLLELNHKINSDLNSLSYKKTLSRMGHPSQLSTLKNLLTQSKNKKTEIEKSIRTLQKQESKLNELQKKELEINQQLLELGRQIKEGLEAPRQLKNNDKASRYTAKLNTSLKQAELVKPQAAKAEPSIDPHQTSEVSKGAGPSGASTKPAASGAATNWENEIKAITTKEDVTAIFNKLEKFSTAAATKDGIEFPLSETESLSLLQKTFQLGAEKQDEALIGYALLKKAAPSIVTRATETERGQNVDKLKTILGQATQFHESSVEITMALQEKTKALLDYSQGNGGADLEKIREDRDDNDVVISAVDTFKVKIQTLLDSNIEYPVLIPVHAGGVTGGHYTAVMIQKNADQSYDLYRSDTLSGKIYEQKGINLDAVKAYVNELAKAEFQRSDFGSLSSDWSKETNIAKQKFNECFITHTLPLLQHVGLINDKIGNFLGESPATPSQSEGVPGADLPKETQENPKPIMRERDSGAATAGSETTASLSSLSSSKPETPHLKSPKSPAPSALATPAHFEPSKAQLSPIHALFEAIKVPKDEDPEDFILNRMFEAVSHLNSDSGGDKEIIKAVTHYIETPRNPATDLAAKKSLFDVVAKKLLLTDHNMKTKHSSELYEVIDSLILQRKRDMGLPLTLSPQARHPASATTESSNPPPVTPVTPPNPSSTSGEPSRSLLSSLSSWWNPVTAPNPSSATTESSNPTPVTPVIPPNPSSTSGEPSWSPLSYLPSFWTTDNKETPKS